LVIIFIFISPSGNGMLTSSTGKSERIDGAGLWLADGIALANQADFFQSIEVDMSIVQKEIALFRQRNCRITVTHVIVNAVAGILAEHPEFHSLVYKNRCWKQKQVDIGLSVAGRATVAPVMVIQNADEKSLAELAAEIQQRTPSVKIENERFLNRLRHWGKFVPFAWLRRCILSLFIRSNNTVRKTVGTFQISMSRNTDFFAPNVLSCQSVLGVGRMKERPVVVNGAVEARPTIWITLGCDHRTWDGQRGETFLCQLKASLEKSIGT
jgi:pyruvate dehydrogenase E2 component (dihydrolipoamide acetyltransferase)